MKKYNYLLFFIFTLHVISAAEKVDNTKSFKVSPGGTLSVSINSGEIKVNVWDKNEVLIRVQGIHDEDNSEVRMSQDNNVIKVRFDGGWSDPDELIFNISVPASFNHDLKTLSGDIALNGSVQGYVKILTHGGDVKTSGIDGTANINTMGGDIAAGNISGDAEITSSGGDITFGNISGKAEITTMGGDITGGDIKKAVTVKTHGGDIKLGTSGGHTEAQTYGGDIIIKFITGNSRLITLGGDIQLFGAKGAVMAKSNGGDLNLLNITGSIEASTASGDIISELIPANKNDSKLITMSGAISLKVPESAKAEISASVRLKGSHGHDENVDIVSDFKSNSKERNRRNLKDSFILNGGGVKIYLESTNSGIEIRKLTKS